MVVEPPMAAPPFAEHQRTAATIAEIEAVLAARGPGQDPILYAAFTTDEASTADAWPGQPAELVTGGFGMLSLVPAPAYWRITPAAFDVVNAVAESLNPATTPAGIRRVLAVPTFAGVLFAAETYELLAAPGVRERHKGPLSTHPLARDSRIVIFIAVDGGIYLASRLDGAKRAQIGWVHPDGNAEGPHGFTPHRFGRRLTHAMIAIVDHVRHELGRPPMSQIHVMEE